MVFSWNEDMEECLFKSILDRMPFLAWRKQQRGICPSLWSSTQPRPVTSKAKARFLYPPEPDSPDSPPASARFHGRIESLLTDAAGTCHSEDTGSRCILGFHMGPAGSTDATAGNAAGAGICLGTARASKRTARRRGSMIIKHKCHYLNLNDRFSLVCKAAR